MTFIRSIHTCIARDGLDHKEIQADQDEPKVHCGVGQITSGFPRVRLQDDQPLSPELDRT